MQNTTLLLIVAIVVVVIIVLAVIAFAMRRRGRRVGFEPRVLPAEELEGREGRMDEIERMFVHQPREAVAAARLLVDEMLSRMGYPVRLTSAERSRDLAHFNRGFADRYRSAGELRDDASTEEMRRALKGYLDTAREIIGEARGRAGGVRASSAQAIGPAVEETRPGVGPAVEETRPGVGPAVEESRPGVGPAAQPPPEQSGPAGDHPAGEDQPPVEDRRPGEERPAAG